jgi:exodeoxyribonuclease VII large subunit
MNQTLSVSELNTQIKTVIETTFLTVLVQGEVSNLTYHSSGHIYFSIKDKSSVISCVMFRGNAKNLKFRLELGQQITITGNLTVYTPRGSYQLICTKIQPSGTGDLALAYEQLKTKLQIKGYFDNSIKKQLPQYPKKLYIITSNTGAVIQDMKKILSLRYPLASMILLPTLVQGDGAKEDIVRNIKKANSLIDDKNSIIILGRGGGSIEDLWAFNEECVANAIYECDALVVSAVGHESDFTISDFVADVRASTPSNAIEITTPNINDLRLFCDSISDDFKQKLETIIYQKEQEFNYILSSFKQQSFINKFNFINLQILNLKQQYNSVFLQTIKIKNDEILAIKNNFELNLPSKKDKKGFAQVTIKNKIIDLKNIKKNDILTLQNSKIMINCEVISKKSI